MRGTRRVTVVALAVSVLLISGCTAAGDGDQTPDPGATPSIDAAPSSAPAFEYPEPGAADEAAFYRTPGREADQSGEIIAGPATLEAERATRIEGDCEGSGAPFEVLTANTDDSGRVLLEGRLDCDDPGAVSEFAYSMVYEGAVQISFTNTESIDQGWIRVVQD